MSISRSGIKALSSCFAQISQHAQRLIHKSFFFRLQCEIDLRGLTHEPIYNELTICLLFHILKYLLNLRHKRSKGCTSIKSSCKKCISARQAWWNYQGNPSLSESDILTRRTLKQTKTAVWRVGVELTSTTRMLAVKISEKKHPKPCYTGWS